MYNIWTTTDNSNVSVLNRLDWFSLLYFAETIGELCSLKIFDISFNVVILVFPVELWLCSDIFVDLFNSEIICVHRISNTVSHLVVFSPFFSFNLLITTHNYNL